MKYVFLSLIYVFPLKKYINRRKKYINQRGIYVFQGRKYVFFSLIWLRINSTYIATLRVPTTKVVGIQNQTPFHLLHNAAIHGRVGDCSKGGERGGRGIEAVVSLAHRAFIAAKISD